MVLNTPEELDLLSGAPTGDAATEGILEPRPRMGTMGLLRKSLLNRISTRICENEEKLHRLDFERVQFRGEAAVRLQETLKDLRGRMTRKGNVHAWPFCSGNEMELALKAS